MDLCSVPLIPSRPSARPVRLPPSPVIRFGRVPLYDSPPSPPRISLFISRDVLLFRNHLILRRFIYSTHHFDKPFHLPQLPVSSTLAIPLPCVLALGWSSCRGKRDEHDGIDTGSGWSRHAIQASHVYRCKVAA